MPVASQSDVHGDNGKYCYKGFRHSLCHGWASGPVAFLTEHVLGVNIVGEACTKIEITPHLGDLQFVKGSIATPHGILKIQHEKDQKGRVKTEFVAPKGVTVVVKKVK